MLIDIGANLTHDSFDDDFDDVLLRAKEAGVAEMIVTGASRQGSQQAATLADEYDHLYATAGIHPHHAEETDDEVIGELAALTSNPRVRAVGETGLDFFRDFSPRATQIASFERHIDLARQTGLPMFLHERDAYPTFGEILASESQDITKVVHCFTGEKEALHTYLDQNCYIGITGWICDERRGTHLLELVKDIPLDRLMIETDAPYLLPRTIRPKPKSRRNEPAFLPEVCRTVAECLQLTSEQLASVTTDNARRFFGLPT